jgi:hypothetical protein
MQLPVNTAVETGLWAQSIIWDRKTPFRDFTQLITEIDEEEIMDRAAIAAAEASKRDGDRQPYALTYSAVIDWNRTTVLRRSNLQEKEEEG